MATEFWSTLRRMRGSIVGWSIGLVLYVLLMLAFYDAIAASEGIEELLASYPKELLAFFGELSAIGSPIGYFHYYFFWYMPVVIGILAVGAGASLIVGDEERGVLDLVLAHPISRTSLFWGRVLGLCGMLAVLLLVSWLSWWLPSGQTNMGLSAIEFFRPFLPLFAVLMCFAMLALLLSMVLPGAGAAGMLAGAAAVGNFLLQGLSRMNADLQRLMKWTLLQYFQGGYAATGIHWPWLLGLFGCALLFAIAAWLLFRRRDIRVAGEHGWQLPALHSSRDREQARR